MSDIEEHKISTSLDYTNARQGETYRGTFNELDLTMVCSTLFLAHDFASTVLNGGNDDSGIAIDMAWFAKNVLEKIEGLSGIRIGKEEEDNGN